METVVAAREAAKLVRRITKRIDKSAGPNACWPWTGGTTDAGYGKAKVDGFDVKAHRLSYVLHKGAIPAGLVIDHLCSNKLCVNPRHLEAVTNAENISRAHRQVVRVRPDGVCSRGHVLLGDNVTSNGRCRQCIRKGMSRAVRLKRIAAREVRP